MKKPWRSFMPADPDREYLALLTYLPLKRFQAVPRFLWYTFQVFRQLSRARGLIGYSMEMRPLHRQFWTLSAWEGEDVLQEFVGRLPHAGIMRALAPSMGETAFLRWRIAGSALPLTWAEAHSRERQQATNP
jgi:hypothetical protein